MATKRQRASGSWEYIFRNKKLLPKAISLTFETEAEGDEYAKRLEALLKAGVVPQEFREQAGAILTVGSAIRQYLLEVNIASADKQLLSYMFPRFEKLRMPEFDLHYAESWVTAMKQEGNLAPSTIRHNVGALARCIDWAVRRNVLPVNPLRLLPKKYSHYTPSDAAAAVAQNSKARVDISRDRRLERSEEIRIREAMDGKKDDGKERVLEMKRLAAIECLFDLALETAMRMREMYTLSLDQIDFDRRTIFLDKTKNGDKRQVPMSSVAVQVLKRYINHVETSGRGMAGFSFDGGRLMPWWDGIHSHESLALISNRLSAQYRRIFEYAKCEDLRFHDLRHEATSRLFERTQLSDIEIAKITGHKSPVMLMRYANLRASDLALRMW